MAVMHADAMAACACASDGNHATHRPCLLQRDASGATHPVTQARCNRLQAFREGMCTTFVAILSFSPAAATGTT
ncbi:hypothetical protein XdyCFBP7245_15905 [Xanthomonas dyei]|uniref:Uncharacterized protein n=1 Tax=Xanthomonas dyei TaxID=743699 RepID=A0A2S7BZX2_9XANT|nr:hypothetical protein XdyCFBP7245_15905 [Xanthomonas dyei]